MDANVPFRHNELRRKVAKGEENRGFKATNGQPGAANMKKLVRKQKIGKQRKTGKKRELVKTGEKFSFKGKTGKTKGKLVKTKGNW